MTDLFWPGDQRAGDLMSDGALLAAMVASSRPGSTRWSTPGSRRRRRGPTSRELVAAGRRRGAGRRRRSRRQPGDRPGRAAAGPRSRAEPARWLHRGLTSQDVIDTALMLCVRDALGARPATRCASRCGTLVRLAESHRRTPMVGRTLTQHARADHLRRSRSAQLATGVLDAADDAGAALASLPVQVGGAAGTLAAAAELAGGPVDGAIARRLTRWPRRCGWRPRRRGTPRGRP